MGVLFFFLEKMGVLFSFFSLFFSLSMAFGWSHEGHEEHQRRDFLFLRALRVLRGSIFNFPKRGVGV